MPVLEALSLTLEVPNLEAGIQFYADAGLQATVDRQAARFRCVGSDVDCVNLIGGAPKKRLHHIALRANGLQAIAERTAAAGGRVIDPPPGFERAGLWVSDPHGMRIHLIDRAPSPPLAAAPAFEINGPGRLVRKRRSAVLPISAYPPVRPLRLGHILVFTPDVLRSVAFVTEALGMGLADRAQDMAAFCCAKKDSDHHVLAFGKSAGVGLHHASFQVADPDEVGRGGRMLADKAKRGDWGFGRHTIGSNFFHYIQDPWGSWFEYYSDMDHIDDYAQWTPTNYGMEDSLASWGPPLPADFGRNYECEGQSAG
jgi:catechol 2,3-dioxygenase